MPGGVAGPGKFDPRRWCLVCSGPGRGAVDRGQRGLPIGAEALQRIEEESFDCVILDLSLPDVDGFKILEQFNAQLTGRQCPVIVYTGKELSADERAELLIYADNVIIKDINSHEKLLQETARFLQGFGKENGTTKQAISRQTVVAEPELDLSIRDIPQGARQADESAPKGSMHILAVDDDVRNAFALSKLLGDRGLRVTIARSGKKALDALAEKPDICLILMDIMMPEMDGYDTIKRIRMDAQFAHLPIIALTARAMKGDAEKCIAAGADDYLAKPIDVNQLVSKLDYWLTDKQYNQFAPVIYGEVEDALQSPGS